SSLVPFSPCLPRGGSRSASDQQAPSYGVHSHVPHHVGLSAQICVESPPWPISELHSSPQRIVVAPSPKSSVDHAVGARLRPRDVRTVHPDGRQRPQTTSSPTLPPMYRLGLDTPEAHEQLQRTIAVIEHLEDPRTHGWLSQPPSPSSETARLATAVPDGPVSLESSLRSAAMSALEAAAHIRFSIQSEHYTLPSLRTILRGAGRRGYVALPDPDQLREANATVLVGQEARSLNQALGNISQITQLPGPKWRPDDVRSFDQKIAAVNTVRLPGDRAMIREAAKLIGTEVAAADNTVGQTTLRDHLTWIWHTSSGSAHGFDWQSHASGNFITDIAAAVSAFHFSI